MRSVGTDRRGEFRVESLPPGDYQVKVTLNGKSQTAPLHLAIDPRAKGQEGALEKQFALAVQGNDRISQLHQAVNEIREVKGQIKNLHTRFGEDARLKPALDAADDLGHTVAVEIGGGELPAGVDAVGDRPFFDELPVLDADGAFSDFHERIALISDQDGDSRLRPRQEIPDGPAGDSEARGQGDQAGPPRLAG